MKQWKVTMLIWDDNLGLDEVSDPARLLRIHASDRNITLEDFDIEEAQQVIQPDNAQ